MIEEGASPVPADYTGPRLEDDERITPSFIDSMIQWFKDGHLIPKRISWQILLGAYDALREEESLVDVLIPEGQTVDVYVFAIRWLVLSNKTADLLACSIGDCHGQYYDFMHLLSLTGKPSETHSLVFDGDLVDRGSWSTEILLTVLAYKCASSVFPVPLSLRDDRLTPSFCRALS